MVSMWVAWVGVLVGVLWAALFLLALWFTYDDWGGVVAVAFGVVACGALVWACIGNRSHGRRRCGGCWYDMIATDGMRCPECGRVAQRESWFFRPRRRWGWAAAAIVSALFSCGVLVSRSHWGWWERLPPPMLYALYTRTDLVTPMGEYLSSTFSYRSSFVRARRVRP